MYSRSGNLRPWRVGSGASVDASPPGPPDTCSTHRGRTKHSLISQIPPAPGRLQALQPSCQQPIVVTPMSQLHNSVASYLSARIGSVTVRGFKEQDTHRWHRFCMSRSNSPKVLLLSLETRQLTSSCGGSSLGPKLSAMKRRAKDGFRKLRCRFRVSEIGHETSC